MICDLPNSDVSSKYALIDIDLQFSLQIGQEFATRSALVSLPYHLMIKSNKKFYKILKWAWINNNNHNDTSICRSLHKN